jgi:hypothetical protein
MREKLIIKLFTGGIVCTFIIIATQWLGLNFASANGWHKTQIAKTVDYPSAPVIAVDQNSVAHVAWTSGQSNYNLFYANSKNNWIPIKITSTANSETPSIFIDKTNAVYLAWVDRRNGPNGDGSGWDIYYATSIDGWVNHLVTAGPTVSCSNPSIAVDDSGDIHITFRRYTTSGGWPYDHQLFYTNKNSGWSEKRISFTGYSRIYWSDMDIDNNGVVHVVFSNGAVANDPTGTEHIWYANSVCSWINVQLDSNATSNWWDDRDNPSIDVDSSNTAHVVWQDFRNTALPGDPAYHSNIPNRKEIYYANEGNAWSNVEIALPIDTNGPRVKTYPSICVQNSLVHVSWIQLEKNDWESQSNLFYSNSNNWNKAVNISNHSDSPIPDPDMPGYFIAAYYVFSSSNALAVDKNGSFHVTWGERDNSNNTYKIYYASNAKRWIEVQIDIKPRSYPNSINPRMLGEIPVAILSAEHFDAPTEVDKKSLTFGTTGNEKSLAYCSRSPVDVNKDGYNDIVCNFYTRMTGFQYGDDKGILKGRTVDETPIEGIDTVKVVPFACCEY